METNELKEKVKTLKDSRNEILKYVEQLQEEKRELTERKKRADTVNKKSIEQLKSIISKLRDRIESYENIIREYEAEYIRQKPMKIKPLQAKKDGGCDDEKYQELIGFFKSYPARETFDMFDAFMKEILQGSGSGSYEEFLIIYSEFHSILRDIMFYEMDESAA